MITPILVLSQIPDDTLVVAYSFPAPSENIWSIEILGDDLLACDSETRMIYKMSSDGYLLDSFPTPALRPRGLARIGNKLWVADDSLRQDSTWMLFECDLTSHITTDSIAYHGIYATHLASRLGMVAIDSSLYISFNGGFGPCITKLDLTNENQITAICCPHPVGMTTSDGAHWIIRHTQGNPPNGNVIVRLSLNGNFAEEVWEDGFWLPFLASGIVYDGTSFWVNDIETNTICKMVHPDYVVGIDDEEQLGFDLHQVYPNPFNPITTIELELSKPDNITLTIYNTLGQRVYTQEIGILQPGHHGIAWDGSTYNSGVYIVEVRQSNYSARRKVMLLK